MAAASAHLAYKKIMEICKMLLNFTKKSCIMNTEESGKEHGVPVFLIENGRAGGLLRTQKNMKGNRQLSNGWVGLQRKRHCKIKRTY